MKWKCEICNIVLHSIPDEHANILNGEYMECPGKFTIYNGTKDTNDLSDVEKLDGMSIKIIERYTEKLSGLKRKNSLTYLAKKFNDLENICLKLSKEEVE